MVTKKDPQLLKNEVEPSTWNPHDHATHQPSSQYGNTSWYPHDQVTVQPAQYRNTSFVVLPPEVGYPQYPPTQQVMHVMDDANIAKINSIEDYLAWSIVNTIFCGLIFGAVAVIFSIQTKRAKGARDIDKAKSYSNIALGFNSASTTTGIIVITSFLFSRYAVKQRVL